MLCICMQKLLKNKRFKRVLCMNVLYIDKVRKNALNLKIGRQKTNRHKSNSIRTQKAINLLS